MTKARKRLWASTILAIVLSLCVSRSGATQGDIASCESQRAAAQLPTARFITFDAVSPAFGLTNQLLTYVGAMYLALLMNRTLAIPPNTAPDFFELVDVAATLEKLPCAFAITRLDDMKKAPTKFPRMRLPGRTTVIHHGRDARAQLLGAVRRLQPFRGARLSTVMWHIPYHAMGDLLPRHITEQSLLNGLVFHEGIRDFAASVKKRLKTQRYAAVHLRLEEDIRAIQLSTPIRKPSADELVRFLTRCFLPQIPADVSEIYVAAGRLEPQYIDALHRLPLPVVLKSDLGLRYRKQVEADSLDKGKRITNHFEAAADLLVLQDAAVVLAADFSTFSRAIQFRRCTRADGPLERLKGPPLFTYDVAFSTVTRRDCVDLKGGRGPPPKPGEVDENGDDGSILISTPWNSMTTYKQITAPFCRA